MRIDKFLAAVFATRGRMTTPTIRARPDMAAEKGARDGYLRRSVSIALFACLWASAWAFAQSPVAESRTLVRIEARQALYAGYRDAAPPLSYLIRGQSRPSGYLWDICGHLFSAVEARLGHPVPVVPIAVSDNARSMMLKTGVIDIDCGGEGNTVAQQKQLAFSVNLYVDEIRLLVGREAGIASFSQLAGKRVITVAGGTAERHLKLAALARGISVQHLLVHDSADAMKLLSAGAADAYADEAAELAAQRARQPEKYALLDETLASEPVALMLPAEDAGWKMLVDQTLVGLMQGGEMARLYEKWFRNPIPPFGLNLDLPMSSGLEAAIRTPADTPIN